MFCSKCGKQLRDDAQFCDGCGARTGLANKPVKEQSDVPTPVSTPVQNNEPRTKREQYFEGAIHKCPFCGEPLSADALTCPTCGHEIRDRKVEQTVQDFIDKVNATEDEGKKIQLIKIYPIPNNRSDILEFMYLAAGNFDAKVYAAHRNSETVDGAWLAKIDQCYAKGKAMFTNKVDLDRIEEIHNQVHGSSKKVVQIKLILIIAGFLLLLGGVIGIVSIDVATKKGLGYVFIGMMAAGILLLVFGFKKKKTNKEIEEDKVAKAHKQELKEHKHDKKQKVVYQNNTYVTVDSNGDKVEDEEDNSGNGEVETKKKKNHGLLNFAARVGFNAALDGIDHEMAKKAKEKEKGKHN